MTVATARRRSIVVTPNGIKLYVHPLAFAMKEILALNLELIHFLIARQLSQNLTSGARSLALDQNDCQLFDHLS